MLLNFQRRFALKVARGEKRQSVRAHSVRYVPVPGHLAHCYTGLRTVHTIRLGVWPIVSVEEVRFDLDAKGIHGFTLDGKEVDDFNRHAFAFADGFESWDAFEQWMMKNHPPGPFKGRAILWAWQPVPVDPALQQGQA